MVFGYLGSQNVYYVMLVSRPLFLMVCLGLNLDVEAWKTQHFARDRLQKWIVAEVGILMIAGPFFMILGGLGIHVHGDLRFFGTQTCYLSCLVASLWRLGGPWGDPGTLGSTRQDTLAGSGLIFINLLLDLGIPFWKFFGYLGQKMYIFMLVSRRLFQWLLGCKSGCPGLEN